MSDFESASSTDPAPPTRGVSAFLRRRLGDAGRYLGPLAVVVLFASLDREGRFLTRENFLTVANQAVVVGIVALGMTCVIVSGGIDLSVGAVVALSGVVTAMALERGMAPLAAAGCGVLAGGICGTAGGLAVTMLGIVPFIATLGMMSVARGLALLLARGQPVRPPYTWLEDLASGSPARPWLLVSNGVLLLVALAGAVAVLMRFGVFGRRVHAIGSNEAAARLCGIPVARVKIGVHALCGALAGVAGVIQYSRLAQGDPTAANGLELDVIAAVVIGGASLSGGVGTVTGTLLGVLTIHLLRNGCNMLGVDNFAQQILIGVIIAGAAALDRLRARLAE